MKKHLVKLAMILGLLTVAVGCGDDEDEGGGEETATAEARFTTYNVGLARGFVDDATARMQPVADAVAAADADVLCLQEVWLNEDDQGQWQTDQIDAIIEAASETYPHTYWERTEFAGDGVSCTDEEAGPLETCARANCDGVPDDNLATCVLEHCRPEFDALSDPCTQCVSAEIGGSLDDIIGACAGEGGAAYSYDAHNGLLLLSKHPLTNTEFTNLDAWLVWRSALHATVSVPEAGDYDVYCTHLTAGLSEPAYGGENFASYEAEQAAQIDDLLTWIGETQTTGNVVLMGDMNTGPAVGGLNAEFPANYQKFVDAGYQAPYLDLADPACTFCGTNTLIAGDANKAIDHVLLDLELDPVDITAQRVFDETVTITTDAGDVESHLSDHYGVQVTVEVEAQ